MTQIHVLVRRINPAFKIDLVQVGYLKDGQFVSLPLDAIADCPISQFLDSSSISDSLYIYHSRITDFITTGANLPGFRVEFFDDTIVVMFDFNLNCDEGTTEEEGKRN
jgi:hypothetical protein